MKIVVRENMFVLCHKFMSEPFISSIITTSNNNNNNDDDDDDDDDK